MVGILLLAATLLSAGQNGMALTVEGDTAKIDPARSLFLTLKLKVPQGVKANVPDLRDRVRGFSLAEDFEEEPEQGKDGSVTHIVNWKLVPEPCAEEYKIAPFVVWASPTMLSSRSDDGKLSFYAGPIRFTAPDPRETVTGEMECDPTKDLPPFSWRLLGYGALALTLLAGLVTGFVWGIRYLMRRVREHRMSPVERAWAELDRLLRKGLPGRGRYKDFYVELTMVVRRYVQRQHGVRAPHLTTEEFFAATRAKETFPQDTLNELMDFLQKADMVKFAGVQATPETADAATTSARSYIAKDDALVARQPAKGGAK